ncbi:MAG: hypothetical protein ACOCQD_02300 [archaeon]
MIDDIFKREKEDEVKLGDLIRIMTHKNDIERGDICIVSQISSGEWRLISLKTGNRYDDTYNLKGKHFQEVRRKYRSFISVYDIEHLGRCTIQIIS